MCQLQPREALITSQSSTWDVIELIFKGRLSWVCRIFDRDYLYKVMHTFPGLNSIFSLLVVVVVCLYAHVIGVTCTGKSGWGIGDRGCGIPFLRGEVWFLGVNFENAQNVGGLNIKTQDWPSVYSFKRRQKNTLWQFFVSNKMLPVYSLAQEPISYFSYQECGVHVYTTPMYTAEIWKNM